MSDLIKMLLQAEIGKSSIENIKSQIKDIEKNTGKIKIEIDSRGLSGATTQFKQAQKQIQSVTKNKIKIFDESELKSSGAEFIKITGSLEGAMRHLEKRYKEIGKVTIEGQNFDAITKSVDRFTLKVEESEGVVKKLRFSLAELSNGQKIWINDKISGADKTADIEARNLKQLHDVRVAIRETTEAEKARTEVMKEQIELYQTKMLGDLDIFSEKNKGKFDESQLDKLRTRVEDLSVSSGNAKREMKEMNIEFGHMVKKASQSNGMLAQITENLVKFARFYIVGQALVNIVSSAREGVQSIKELDSSLTELSKVSDLTSTQLKEFTDQAYEAGRTIGRTGKEVIDATSEFKRAGYEINEAFELSQQALLLTNIGDGMDDVKESSSSLIAILKGFKMEAQETAHIVDALNEVSNNYAVDTNNLTEILKRTSGTIGQTGTSYEQLIGLATGGYESLRNAEMVASGINMISQRLRSMDEEGNKVEGLIPKIQEAFDKYTGGAVSVIDKQNGGLNSTYEILEQLSKVYPTLSDEAKAYINEAVAGNRQNKVLVAIMENWKNVENATTSATNSLGSANAENEKYLNSIEGKTAQLTSSMQLFWKNLINSDSIKLLIDSLNALVIASDNLVNNSFAKFLITTTLITASLPLLSKGLAALSSKLITTTIGMNLLAAAQGKLTIQTNLLTGAFLMSPFFKVALIVGGITAIVKAVDYFTTTLKEQQEIVATLTSDINALQSEYDSLLSTENRDNSQNNRLALLKAELDTQKELLNIEQERLVNQQFFDREVDSYKDGTYKSTGADEAKKDIQELIDMQKELANTDVESEDWTKLNERILDVKSSLIEKLKVLDGAIASYQEIEGKDVPQMFIDLAEAIRAVVIDQDALEDSIENANNALDGESESLEDLTKKFEEVTDKIQAYYKILDELNSKEGLSAQSKEDIITKYQQLLPYLDDEKVLREELIRIIQEEERVQREAYQAMLMVSEEFYNAKIKGNSELVKKLNEYYGGDFANYKDLAEAKSKIEAKLLENLSGMWAKYYGAIRRGNTQTATMLEDQVQKRRGDWQSANTVLSAVHTMGSLESYFDDLTFKGIDFTGINKSSIPKSSSTKSSSSKAKADNRQFLESIDAEIRAIKIKNDGLLKSRDLLEEQLALAKDIEGEEGFNKQYRIMGELIEHNTKILESFKQEQDLVHQRANDIRATYSQYNTESWFDANAEQTTAYIEQYNKATKDQQEEMDTLFKQIQALKKAWMESNSEIKNVNSSIEEMTIEQDKLIEQQRELARQKYIKEMNEAYEKQQEQLSALEEIQERIVAIIRKRGEEELKLLDETYNKDMEQLDERHNKRKQQYADELDEFKKMIQGKIDALDDQYAEEDYLKALQEERDKATELQKQIDVLSLDTSLTARNQTIELRKQLATQNEKIADMQQKRERDLVKKSLQDQLKEKEDQVKEIEDIADDQYKNDKKRLEEDYRINKEYHERKYSDEKVYSEARQAILDGEVEVAKGRFVELEDAFKDFEDTFGKGMGILGDIIKDKFSERLKDAQDLIRETDNLTKKLLEKVDADDDFSDKEIGYKPPKDKDTGGSKGGSGGIYMSASDFNKYINYKLIYDMAKSAGNKASMDAAGVGAQAIRKKYGIASDKYSYDDLKNRSYKDVAFKHGGKITQTGTVREVKFDGTQTTPEWIFNDSQLKSIVRDVTLSAINVAIPKIPSIAGVGGSGAVFQIDNLINVEGNVTKETIPLIKQAGNDIAETLKNLNKGGIFRPVKI